jgi:putative phosphoribosyl transferase
MDRVFKNREDAAYMLAENLIGYKNKNAVVIAIPRGGVPIGAIIANALELPLDIALSKKIGHPTHKEFAIGAVSLDESIVDARLEVAETYLIAEIPRLQNALRENYERLKPDMKPINLEGKSVIITDDGIATGHTMSATIRMVKKRGAREIIIAVPVISPNAAANIKNDCDRLIALKTPPHFRSVGQFYSDFNEVSEEEVIRLLNNKWNPCN